MTEGQPVRLLPIYNSEGYPVGRCLTETEVHTQNIWHACVNVCVTDREGNIYQQRRGLKTKIFPGKMDMFLANDHIVDDDEVPAMAVGRALSLKVGIRLSHETLCTLQPVLITPSQYWVTDPSFSAQNGNHGYYHYAFEYVYVIRLDGLGTKIPLHLREGRVLGVRRRSLARMIEDFQSSHISEAYREYAHRTPNEASMLQAIYTAVTQLTR